MSWRRTWNRVRGPVAGERGFTLIEVMLAIVLMTFGLVAVADVFPHGLALGLYGKDQTTAAGLGQQKIEYYKNQATSILGPLVGDYTVKVTTEYFDTRGNATTQTATGAAAPYFLRDVQIQYWTWNGATSQFTLPASPYAVPGAGISFVYRVSTATHWLVRGQTVFASGNTSTPNGCVNGAAQASTGLGCVQVSTFITP